MDKQRTTAAQRAGLRRRYGSPPAVVMPCLQCGQGMALDPPEPHGAGIIWTWRCGQSPEHGTVCHIDHYGDMDVIDVLADADALAGALAEVARLRAALTTIRDHYGQVADEALEAKEGQKR